MNFKKLFTTIVSCAALLGFAGAASAASDVNLYGASAQFVFWAGEAANFMTGQGCTGAARADLDSKNSITKATCGGVPTYFRTSSKASFDGICAMKGILTSANANCSNPCPDPHQRLMVDENTCNWTTGVCTSTKCVTVNAGASDVQASTFSQESHGALLGPLGGAYTNRSFKGAGTLSDAGLTDNRPVVVPFAFYINKSVKKSDGVTTVTDLTSAQAKLIFSGQIQNWADMLGFSAQPINVCFRHAGSGTHAALDVTQVRPANVQTIEDLTGPYHYYFNDGSSDMMKCVNGSGTWAGTGAVGYADADQSLTSYTNTAQVTLNGVAATKTNIQNGAYDFWTIENLYTATSTDTWLNALVSYAKNPAKITNAWYSSECCMIFTKSNDLAYPIYRGLSTDPSCAGYVCP